MRTVIWGSNPETKRLTKAKYRSRIVVYVTPDKTEMDVLDWVVRCAINEYDNLAVGVVLSYGYNQYQHVMSQLMVDGLYSHLRSTVNVYRNVLTDGLPVGPNVARRDTLPNDINMLYVHHTGYSTTNPRELFNHFFTVYPNLDYLLIRE